MECVKLRIGFYYFFYLGVGIVILVIYEEIEFYCLGFIFNFKFFDIREFFVKSGWWSGVIV